MLDLFFLVYLTQGSGMYVLTCTWQLQFRIVAGATVTKFETTKIILEAYLDLSRILAPTKITCHTVSV